jgi:gliding motility associated protien GldN
MKPLYTIGLILAFGIYSSSGFSQSQPATQKQAPPQAQAQSQNTPTPQRLPPRQRPSDKTQPADNMPGLTERAKIKSEQNSKTPEHVVWLREMYRIIDLDSANNAALYYPVQPVGDRMNLFTIIFKLLADGKIKAYNYLLDKDEVFTDAEKLDFEETLKKFRIPYQKQGTGDNVRFIVEDSNIPSYEALQYQIKEGWYFDAATGTFKSRIIAICPLLVQTDYSVGGKELNAVCWIPYESLRPYLSRAMIMTSNYNNVMTNSIDDFFTKGMYQGDIVKTVNMKDQSLAQQVGDAPEKLRLAQDSIENQLKTFRQQLWVQQDSTQVTTNNEKKGSSVKGSSVKREKTTTTAKTEKEQKPKATKPEKSSSASPVKSVRRTR